MEARDTARLTAVTLVVTAVTAWFSYAYFAIDEHFQVVEPTFHLLGMTPEWTLPWEIHERMRPMLQPFVYFVVGKIAMTRDPFILGFLFRLVTGLACVLALRLFIRTALPWYPADRARLFVQVTTLAGFLPYLFVRTSSETFSLAALTGAFAVLLRGASAPEWKLGAPSRLALAGFLFGVAFEARFHTAFVTLAMLAWLRIVARASWRSLGWVVLGGIGALAFGALVDRWGYGEWTFPAWRYFRANVLEGAASYFGTDPPFAYLWMLPANVFAPIVVALLVALVVAWRRAGRHPLTWATLPFFLVHNLIPHKEERFLFPIAVFAVALVPLACARIPRVLVAINFALMALLAFYPLGWNHHVRFQRALHDRGIDELHAHALPDFELGLPAYHPRVWDIEKSDAATIARRIDAHDAKPWLVTDLPVLPPELEGRATLVWTELPSLVSAETIVNYNEYAKPPLRRLEYRTLWRITEGTSRP